ncbi:MAG: exosortase [Solirubrobacterales bacterium]
MTGKSRLQELDIRTVVLVGGRDFGRCPLAARMPAALWPLGDRPALAHLLDHLFDQGLSHATVCCSGDVVTDVEEVCRAARLSTRVMAEEVSNGTGGCLRDAVSSDPGDLILMLSGSMAAPPQIEDLIDVHQAANADLTVVFNPGWPEKDQPGSAAEIFLCRPQVLGHIPGGGYSDIKEGLIPTILRAGGTVRPVVLSRQTGNFHDRKGYLKAVDILFQSGGVNDPRRQFHDGSACVGVDVFTHPRSRIYGPVLIGERARVLDGAVVVGPAIIGRDAVIGENSAIVRSAVWARAVVGRGCEVRESILDYGVVTPDGVPVVGEAISATESRFSRGREGPGSTRSSQSSSIAFAKSHLDSGLQRAAQWMQMTPKGVSALAAGIAVLAAFLWSYWPTVLDLAWAWRGSDEYSSGMLVPVLAGYVIWSRREEIAGTQLRSAILAGAIAFLLAQAIRGMGLFYMYQSAERLSFVLSIAAIVLLVMGWRYLWKLTPILLFLCLMLPWPNRIQAALAMPLQQWATGSAVFCLELAGWSVLRDGNVIHIGDASVAVAEACNGLRMITAFFVISGLVVLLTRREWWVKLVILISSLPIALLCNTLRLTVTAVFFTIIEGEVWEQRFHDWGGYAMMPLALAMVVGELWLLSRLTTPPVLVEPAIISRRPPQHVPDP